MTSHRHNVRTGVKNVVVVVVVTSIQRFLVLLTAMTLPPQLPPAPAFTRYSWWCDYKSFLRFGGTHCSMGILFVLGALQLHIGVSQTLVIIPYQLTIDLAFLVSTYSI